jgi:hypothetical protein
MASSDSGIRSVCNPVAVGGGPGVSMRFALAVPRRRVARGSIFGNKREHPGKGRRLSYAESSSVVMSRVLRLHGKAFRGLRSTASS